MMAHFVFDLGQIHPRIPRAKLLGSGASPAPTVLRHCFSLLLPSAVASKKGEGPSTWDSREEGLIQVKEKSSLQPNDADWMLSRKIIGGENTAHIFAIR